MTRSGERITVLQRIGARAPGDERRNEHIGVDQQSHETQLKTSSSAKITRA